MEKVTIGNAELWLGDCMDVLPMLDKSGLVLITDPPYLMTATGGGIGAKRKYLSDIDNHIDGGFDFSLLDGFDNWFVFCAKSQLIDLLSKAESLQKRWALLTWNKNNPTPLTNNNYLPDTEYMVHAFQRHDYKEKQKFIVGNVEKSGYDHPSVKPPYVMDKVINSASHVSDTIIDIFMGSGSTGVSALKFGRKFIGIEREPKYFEIACRRIEDAQKQVDMFVTPELVSMQQGDLLGVAA